MKPVKRLLVLLSALAVFLMLGSAPQAAPGKRLRLFLKSAGGFDPVIDRLRLDADLTAEAAERESPAPIGSAIPGKPQGKLGHWIVQFDGPVQDEWKAPIFSLGGLLLDYIPDYSYVVRIPQQQVRGLRNLAHVRSVQPYQPAFALSGRFPRRAVVVPVTISTFTASDISRVTAQVKRWRGVVLNSAVFDGKGIVQANIRPAALRPLARTFGVSWIEYRDEAELHNDQNAATAGVDDVRTNVGLYGANQIVAVFDTGLDTGNTGTVHSDFAGRVAATHVYGTQGNWSDLHGHGTHVMGTVLGSGVNSGADPSTHSYPVSGTPAYAGMAPEALLVVQSNLNSSGGLGGADSITFKSVLKDAYDDGARVHSNSWGAISDGTYNEQCVTVDTFANQAKDMVICFSAGNSGVDVNADGLVDSGSKRAPGTSKNVITVGASENNRPTISSTWGSSYASPISTDLIADNINGMCAFSSRGPCDDSTGTGGIARIKPDVVAPGSVVASARTSQLFMTSEGFESPGPGTGSLPSGWTTNGSAFCGITSNDKYSGSQCFGIGNVGVNQGYAFSGTLTVHTPALNTSKAGTVVVSYRTRYNIKPGDSARVTRASGSAFDPQFTGSSGGWVYRTDVIPTGTDAVRFRLTSLGADASEGYYWEIDDVRVAPVLTSTLSRLGSEVGGSSRDELYMYSNGTSMSCPAVAGMAALVREYYQERKNLHNPSAALVKATLITSASSMGTGQYGSPQEIPTTRPNYVNGWGRVDIQKALAPATTSFPNTKHLFADVSTGLKTGGVDTYTINVAAGTPLNVGLVYTDAPGTAAASVTLVNDLNLSVDPDGAGATPASNGNGVAGDNRNNVETVDFASPSAGTYTITVTGTNVPTGQQPYALVIYGDVFWQNTLTVSPATTTCEFNKTVRFSALLNGMPTPGVSWSVVGGGPGSIDSTGLYSAPGSGTSATVRATYGALSQDATVSFVSASSQATVYITITHPEFSHVSGATVGVGSNPDSPLGSVTAGGSFGSGGGTLTFWFNCDTLVSHLPPSTSKPWWVRVNDGTGGSTATVESFQVILGARDGTGFVTSGERFNSTNTPCTVGDITGAPYAWIDTVAPAAAVSAPADGSTQSGAVTFSATASDNDRITRVDFYVDDRLIGTDTSAPYSVNWDTTAETNVRHRLTVRATDKSGNVEEDYRLVTTSNGGSRPNVRLSVGSWSFNSNTREMTATATFTNEGALTAHRISLQRLTLWCTGPTFTGFRQVYMEPVSGTLPTNITSLNAGANSTLQLRVVMPPEVTSVPRWSGTGTYYDAASGGNPYFL